MKLNADLGERIAVVTGAGRGVGKAISEALVHHGATVVAAARTEPELTSLANDHRGQIVAIRTDVTDEQSVVSLFADVREQFGKLDILVNNAGQRGDGKIHDCPAEVFDQVVSVNLRGTFLCCREAMKLMVPKRSGVIINIASVAGIKGFPNVGAYCASKHGVLGLTKTLSQEAAEYGIRVSAVLPGRVDTAMSIQSDADLDPTTLMKPDDIAQTVLFLLSLSERAHIDEIYIHRRSTSPL